MKRIVISATDCFTSSTVQKFLHEKSEDYYGSSKHTWAYILRVTYLCIEVDLFKSYDLQFFFDEPTILDPEVDKFVHTRGFFGHDFIDTFVL